MLAHFRRLGLFSCVSANALRTANRNSVNVSPLKAARALILRCQLAGIFSRIFTCGSFTGLHFGLKVSKVSSGSFTRYLYRSRIVEPARSGYQNRHSALAAMHHPAANAPGRVRQFHLARGLVRASRAVQVDAFREAEIRQALRLFTTGAEFNLELRGVEWCVCLHSPTGFGLSGQHS